MRAPVHTRLGLELLLLQLDVRFLEDDHLQGVAGELTMRDWFLALYQILLGQDQGPRMGSFIALFGIPNFVKLVEEKIS